MAETPGAGAPLPSSRLLNGLTAIKVSRFEDDTSLQAALDSMGAAFPHLPGEVSGSDPWLVWLNPREALALGLDPAPLREILATLPPGCSDTSMALDVSESIAAFELLGPRVAEWLSHLVDASAIPTGNGRGSRCRLADVPVTLLRMEQERFWLVAERPLAPYIDDWLAYAHAGAFAAETM